MSIRIEPYRDDHVPAVRDFNRRLDGKSFPLAETAVPEWLPPAPGRRIYQESFLAVEDGLVRGGYLLKRQDFSLAGETVSIGYYHSVVSEGLVDPKYGMVGIQLLMDALRREPLLYALGMGGFDKPLPRMLRAAGWSLSAVPFHFRVARPARFLRNIQPLRSTPARRVALDLAAWTGAGSIALPVLQRLRQRRVPRARVQLVDRFGPSADALWEECRPDYPFIAVRDAATLRILYPGDDFLRLDLSLDGKTIGWAVLRDTPMRGDKYFGNMRLGSIVDFLAAPRHAPATIAAAARTLRDRGVDLVVANQGHHVWREAFRSAGFLDGPSNFLFASSKVLTKRLSEAGCGTDRLFLTRGDGDGPIHL